MLRGIVVLITKRKNSLHGGGNIQIESCKMGNYVEKVKNHCCKACVNCCEPYTRPTASELKEQNGKQRQ